MHPTAMRNGELFFSTYLNSASEPLIFDIGSQDINGSLRQLAPPGSRYLGLDFLPGPGVDLVLEDPYALPFADRVADVVVSSSCFEHIEMFWLMFNEILRVLKPEGLFYLNAPSNGEYHRYPVDCWRFYPDAGEALVRWARRSGYSPALLESFTTYQRLDIWNDFIAVFVRDADHVRCHASRMIDSEVPFMNGRIYGNTEILCYQPTSEDGDKLHRLTGYSKPTE